MAVSKLQIQHPIINIFVLEHVLCRTGSEGWGEVKIIESEEK